MGTEIADNETAQQIW